MGMKEYCDNEDITTPGLLFQINIDKASNANYKAMTNCVKGLIKQLPFKTVTSTMFVPEQIDVATKSDMTPQNKTGNNNNMIKFLNDAMTKLDDGSLNRQPWDHDDNFGNPFAWYMMANRAKYYINQVSHLYNK